MSKWIMAASIAAVMSLGAFQVVAQPNSGGQGQSRGGQPGGGGGGGFGGRSSRGNFDPAQFRQQMMNNVRQNLEVTSDDEWKAIEPRIQKIMDLRRESFSGMGRSMFGRGRRGGDNGPGGDSSRRGGSSSASSANPAADALQKAIDSKASKAELKAALEKYTAARKAKQAELEQAQAALRELLTPRQEAIATLDGLL